MDDVVGLDEDKSVIYFDGYLIPPVFLARHHADEPVELPLQRLVFAPALARAGHRGFEPRRIHRLQHVIHRVHFERLDRALVECGDENHAGSGSRFHQAARDFEAGQPGHLHVEEGDIRRVPGDFVERLDAVGRLADDLDAIELAQQEAQLVPRQLLIVGDDGRQG